jgi:hypothetical protein
LQFRRVLRNDVTQSPKLAFHPSTGFYPYGRTDNGQAIYALRCIFDAAGIRPLGLRYDKFTSPRWTGRPRSSRAPKERLHLTNSFSYKVDLGPGWSP